LIDCSATGDENLGIGTLILYVLDEDEIAWWQLVNVIKAEHKALPIPLHKLKQTSAP